MSHLALALTVVWTIYGLGLLAALHRLRETHHLYYGIVLAAIGALLGWPWLQWLALALIVDDCVEHTVQVVFPNTKASFFLWAYAQTVAKLPIIQSLNHWLDRRFQ